MTRAGLHPEVLRRSHGDLLSLRDWAHLGREFEDMYMDGRALSIFHVTAVHQDWSGRLLRGVLC